MLLTQLCVFAFCYWLARKKGVNLPGALEKADDRLFSAVLVVLSASLPFLFIQDGHNWGGDFSCYIAQAQSVLSGTMREQVEANSFMMRNSHFMHGPAAYPWGFPLLLVPVISLFGVNYIALKSVNVLFFVLTDMVFYHILKQKASLAYARTGAFFLATNTELLRSCDYVLSDIPFLFFSLLSVYYIDKLFRSEDRQLYYGLMTGMTCFLAYFVRTAGLVSLLTLLTMDFLLLAVRTKPLRRFGRRFSACRQSLPAHLAAYGAFLLGFVLNKLIFPAGESGYGYYFRSFSVSQMRQHFDLYFDAVWQFFANNPATYFPFALLVFLLFFYGVAKLAFTESAAVIYCLGTFASVIIFPAFQGIRYLYGFVLIVILISLQTASRADRQLDLTVKGRSVYAALKSGLVAVAAVSVCLALVSISINNIRNRNVSYSNQSRTKCAVETYDYIMENVDEDDVIVFFKPRVLWLNTHRRSISVETSNMDKLSQADYVLFTTGTDSDLYRYCRLNEKAVFRNREFILYRLTDRDGE